MPRAEPDAGREDRRYPRRPLCGVGAVLLSPELREVLLVERGAPPSLGAWTFPGGLIEGGEGAREACAREVREETGLRAFTLEGLVLVAERILPDDAGRAEYHYLILDFWGRAERVLPEASSDARAARWVPVEEVASLRTTRGVPLALERALALARGEPPPGSAFSE